MPRTFLRVSPEQTIQNVRPVTENAPETEKPVPIIVCMMKTKTYITGSRLELPRNNQMRVVVGFYPVPTSTSSLRVRAARAGIFVAR